MNGMTLDGQLLLLAAGLATIASAVLGGRYLRHGLALAGAIACADAILAGRGMPVLLLALLFTLINLMAVFRVGRRRATLTPDTAALHRKHLAGLSAGEAQLLLDQGNIVEARAGEELTREGAEVSNLYFLLSGCAAVLVDDRVIGRADAGDLIGEACLIGDGRASATVRLADDNCRLWFVPKERLLAFLKAQPKIANELSKATLAGLRDKLETANRTNAAD